MSANIRQFVYDQLCRGSKSGQSQRLQAKRSPDLQECFFPYHPFFSLGLWFPLSLIQQLQDSLIPEHKDQNQVTAEAGPAPGAMPGPAVTSLLP